MFYTIPAKELMDILTIGRIELTIVNTDSGGSSTMLTGVATSGLIVEASKCTRLLDQTLPDNECTYTCEFYIDNTLFQVNNIVAKDIFNCLSHENGRRREKYNQSLNIEMESTNKFRLLT